MIASVDDDFAEVFRRQFEAGVAQLRTSRSPRDLAAFLRDLARYFVQFTPGPNSYYRRLTRAVIDADAQPVFATLNYDLLLELAILAEGRSVAYSGLPIPERHFAVLKPHGSCNFLPDLGSTTIRNSSIGFTNTGAALIAPIKIAARQSDVVHFCDTEDSIAPALAMFEKGKQVPFCPSFVQGQLAAWGKHLAEADRAFIVGVRVNAEDGHIWGPLSRCAADLYHVGPDEAGFMSWAKQVGRNKVHHLANTFAESLTTLPDLLK